MPSLRDNFDELMERVNQGREFGHASFEPVFYLVFSPREILEVKRKLPAWCARLNNEGWEVIQFSIAEQVATILAEARLRHIWIAADQRDPYNWQKTNLSLAGAITGNSNELKPGTLQWRLQQQLESLRDNPDSILLVTDLEALHPYTRIGVIEGQLAGSFHVPTVFFYPGERTGKTRLKFLGIYPEDGNYRSAHIGG